MVLHIYAIDGFNHTLFHVERCDGWQYRFRQVGDDLPAELLEWSRVYDVSGHSAMISPSACDHAVEVEWRYEGGEWSQAALRETARSWVDLRIVALADFQVTGLVTGDRDVRFVAMVRGGVSVYGVVVDSLSLKKGESIDLNARAMNCSCSNVLLEAGEFTTGDSRMQVFNLGPSRKNFKEVGGPAIAEPAEIITETFFAKTGECMDPEELKKLIKEL